MNCAFDFSWGEGDLCEGGRLEKDCWLWVGGVFGGGMEVEVMFDLFHYTLCSCGLVCVWFCFGLQCNCTGGMVLPLKLWLLIGSCEVFIGD